MQSFFPVSQTPACTVPGVFSLQVQDLALSRVGLFEKHAKVSAHETHFLAKYNE